MTSDLVAVENRLWAAADQLWANTGLKPSEFSTPVLGLIFLRYADTRYAEADAALAAKGIAPADREPMDYQAEGVLYLPDDARFAYLQSLTEGADLGRHITRAMTLVEDHNPELRGVLPRGYNLLPNATLVELLRLLAPLDLQGDAFGKVYEYFLGNFALKEGQKGGVFYTPTSIVRLIVEIIEPFHGRIFDPACGSGGMFVQSAEFVRRHQRNATTELTVFGTEKAADTVKLAKMNLAVHGLSGDIREGNTYYEDPHKAVPGVASTSAAASTSSWPIRRSMSPAWTRTGSRTTPASRSACPAPTTPTTCGFSSSTPRSTTAAAPASSWPTRPATRAAASWKSAKSSSRAARWT